MLEWWGYEHVNGTIHVKRFFDYEDINEARASNFVNFVAGPVFADHREHAETLLEVLIRNKK